MIDRARRAQAERLLAAPDRSTSSRCRDAAGRASAPRSARAAASCPADRSPWRRPQLIVRRGPAASIRSPRTERPTLRACSPSNTRAGFNTTDAGGDAGGSRRSPRPDQTGARLAVSVAFWASARSRVARRLVTEARMRSLLLGLLLVRPGNGVNRPGSEACPRLRRRGHARRVAVRSRATGIEAAGPARR